MHPLIDLLFPVFFAIHFANTVSASTTSSSSPPCLSSPRALAQEAGTLPRPHRSSTWSTASTADSGPSPVLPTLTVPRLTERVRALLQTPPPLDNGDELDDDLNSRQGSAPEDDGNASYDDGRFVTASWGSPYLRPQSQHLHQPSSSPSSDLSEDLPLHQLEIHTPFLRPAPCLPEGGSDQDEDQDDQDSQNNSEGLALPLFADALSSNLVSAAVLAKRARRPAGGLTENWIRQHTAGDAGEASLWLSDNSNGDSTTSSLSGSVSCDAQNRHDIDDEDLLLRTPRATVPLSQRSPHARTYHPRNPSSLETLREANLSRPNELLPQIRPDAMASISSIDKPIRSADGANDANGTYTTPSSHISAAPSATASDSPATPQAKKAVAFSEPAAFPLLPPSTPPYMAISDSHRRDNATTSQSVTLDPLGEVAVLHMVASPKKTPRRIKKKLPWKGKNIMVLLPLDDQRGRPGKPPMPLTQTTMDDMLRSWEELGYDVNGFDLDLSPEPDVANDTPLPSRSMSRPSWPDEQDITNERAHRTYPVVLPDLNAWKNYVDELNEAKLRALGVSFAVENPPLPPSISPAAFGASISRRSSATAYPPLPFSPPIPTSSASSSHGPTSFSFPPALVPNAASIVASSTGHSPSIPTAGSPTPFGVGPKFNARQSISIPAVSFQLSRAATPSGFSPQTTLMQQGLGHCGSPSLASLSVMSPPSSVSPEGGFTSLPPHQRHQSLQYPIVQRYPQLQAAARTSPRLHELHEVKEGPEEQLYNKSSSKTPDTTANSRPFVQHNASLSLQKEIDDAEYHLEEQFRSQFEHDRDYSPHAGQDAPDAISAVPVSAPNPMIPTAPQHNCGMSVQFAPVAAIQDNGPVLHHPRPHSRGHSLANAYYDPDESRTGLGESGTSVVVDSLGLGNHAPEQPSMQRQVHNRSFSTASNPWTDNGSFSGQQGSDARRISHASKPSLSNLNVEAPEFKFNPANATAFNPTFSNASANGSGSGQLFGAGAAITSGTFQPSIFSTSLSANAPMSTASSQSSLPTALTASSKINVNAPIFSPRQSDFSFSAIGPKFRPDAPTFTPVHSFSDSLTSPAQSGGESAMGGNRTSSIFGKFDLNIPDIVKPVKRSKAVPIVRPASRHSPKPTDAPRDHEENSTQYDKEGHVIDDSRVKRARAISNDDGNAEALFAEPSLESAATPTRVPPACATEADPKEDAPAAEDVASTLPCTQVTQDVEPEAAQDSTEITTAELEVEVETSRLGEYGGVLAAEDTTLSSTMLSGSTDGVKATATDAVDLTVGEDIFRHNKSLSANAKPFTPGASLQGSVFASNAQHDLTAEDVLSVTEVPEVNQIDASGSAVEPTEILLATQSLQTRFSSQSPPPPPAFEKPKGLAASRYAPPSSPTQALKQFEWPSSPPSVPNKDDGVVESVEQLPARNELYDEREPTFQEIDGIMRHLIEVDPAQGVNKAITSRPAWNETAPEVHMSLAAATESPLHLLSPSLSQPCRQLITVQPNEIVQAAEVGIPSLSPPLSARLSLDTRGQGQGSGASDGSMPLSEWDGDFAIEEQLKLESRVNFFDGHMNDIVDGILTARLEPLEKALGHMQRAISSVSRDASASRREYRSNTGEVQESDADDEDDEVLPVLHRSMSPRRDRRMEKMRAVVLEALASHEQSGFSIPSSQDPAATGLSNESAKTILKSLADVKEQLSQSLLKLHGEDIHNIVESAVERHMSLTSQSAGAPRDVIDDDFSERKTKALEERLSHLEQRLQAEESKTQSEVAIRRVAEDQVAELRRKLEQAETKIEVEILNRSAFDQRIADLGENLKVSERKIECEIEERRAVEDRLAGVQRLLRISSEEEKRLREAVDERDSKLKAADERSEADYIRIAALEASQASVEKARSNLQNDMNTVETDLRKKTQEARHWQSEAERASDLSRRQGEDLAQMTTELKHVKKVIDICGTQLEENERLRDSWRSKFVALQDEMSHAAHDIAEESARWIKREQALIARQEALDAQLQAEARTRERLESELDRLEGGERQAMRAVGECKRMEALVGELRTENHKLQQSSLRYQAAFEEARESATRDMQRTRDALQAKVDEANHQATVARGELEDQIARLRGDLDRGKVDANTSRARLEALLDEVEATKRAALEEAAAAKCYELEEAKHRHQSAVEDMQTRYERQISNTAEDAQRTEENLLERLSISTSRTEHLQERVAHLEEKLVIAQAAAAAAAKAAKAVSATDGTVNMSLQPTATAKTVTATHHGMVLPEKISPQALRETIMVLQEQLRQQEERNEELETMLAKADPEADTKIAKRDDEILWLRELLAVRHSDLKDIITALSQDDHDPERVRDAVIRLQANLQMEEQERARAMNGGSAIKLPALAASLRDVATPRVAQAVGPLAAAWGNWRKARDSNASTMGNVAGTLSSLSGALMSSPSTSSASKRHVSTLSNTSDAPSRAASLSVSSRSGNAANQSPSGGDSSFLSGLSTPPRSDLRQTLPTRHLQGDQQQPKVSGSTDRRLTAEHVNGHQVSRFVNKPALSRDVTTPPLDARRGNRNQLVTPLTMMRASGYDSDANVEEFDDAAFFED